MSNSETKSQKRFSMLPHNGVDCNDYPCDHFFLAPYPESKTPIFNHDNLTTVNRPYYLENTTFKNALSAAESRWGAPGSVRDISWRLHILISFFEMAHSLIPNGCFVELGTGKGYMAHGIATYFKSMPINGYLYDTFDSYLPAETASDSSMPTCFSYADGNPGYPAMLEEDLNSISITHNWKVIQGLLPLSIKQTPPDSQISFLHVDLNEETAEYQSLLALNDRITPSTFILFDDTGAPGSENQHVVHKRYAESLSKRILYLPTGQALVF